MDMLSGPYSLDVLLANVCHLHHTRAHQLLESLKLYRGQPPLLNVLWNQEGLSQSDLGARLRLAPATVSKMLNRMERTGFVRRVPDKVDQRVSRVYLTDAGRAVRGALDEVHHQIFDETFANLTEEERATLKRLLLRLRDNLLEATGEEPWK